MTSDLKAAMTDMAENREQIIDKLLQFATTDVLLFWSGNNDLAKRQEQLWMPVLKWAEQEIQLNLKTTTALDVPEQEEQSIARLRSFLEGFSDKELVAFFKAALNMRSVLLAAAMVKGKISAEQAFQAAFIEELWQAERWGVVPEAQKKRDELKQELVDIETFLKHDE